jgi:molecular chaperone DnaK (HSP70)
MCTHVIERNTTIPISKSQIFTTAAPFQSSVEINVLQGERPLANQNKSLGKFRLKGIQRAMAGVPQIEVTFTIDANGIVNVSAKDLKTGKAQDITIEASSNMSDEELQSAIHDAERYASEDAQFREDREARGKLQALIQRAMAGVPQIEVTFTIDANGIVNVSAKDLKTGKAQDITIEASSNMSDAELQSAIHDAERYAAEDAQFREDRAARGKLQALIVRAEEMERAAVKNKDKEHFKKYRETFKGLVKDAKKALNGKDAAAVHNAVAGLEALVAEIEGGG